MPTTLSVDLRERVASAVSAGATCWQAAERFGVSRASASRWSRQRRMGHVAPKPLGGDQRSRRIEAPTDLVRQTYRARPQILLRELTDAAGARLLYLPPYSPEFNTIELAFAQAQGAPAQHSSPNRPRSLRDDLPNLRSLLTRGGPQLLHRCRLRG